MHSFSGSRVLGSRRSRSRQTGLKMRGATRPTLRCARPVSVLLLAQVTPPISVKSKRSPDVRLVSHSAVVTSHPWLTWDNLAGAEDTAVVSALPRPSLSSCSQTFPPVDVAGPSAQPTPPSWWGRAVPVGNLQPWETGTPRERRPTEVKMPNGPHDCPNPQISKHIRGQNRTQSSKAAHRNLPVN